MSVFLKKFLVVVSNTFFRIIMTMVLILSTMLLLRVNKSVVAFAKEVDDVGKLSEKVDVDLPKFKVAIGTEYVSSYSKKIQEKQQESKFVTASTSTDTEYPIGWIEDFNGLMITLQKIFPEGSYWNSREQSLWMSKNIFNVSNTPCNHSLDGELYCNTYNGRSDEVYPYESSSVQCRGFASMLSDLVFGEDAEVRVFEDYDEIRIGDQARIDGDYHTVFIIDKTDDYVIVAECNRNLENCQINWGRKILREDLTGWYITRWE